MAGPGRDRNAVTSEDFNNSPGHSLSSQSSSHYDYLHQIDRSDHPNHARAEDEPLSIHDNTLDPQRFMFQPATEPTTHTSGYEYSSAGFYPSTPPFSGFSYPTEGRYFPVANQSWHRPDQTVLGSTTRHTHHYPVNSPSMGEDYDSGLSTTNNANYLSPPYYSRAGQSPTYPTTPSPIDSTLNNPIDSGIASPASPLTDMYTPLSSTIGTPMTSHSQSSPRIETAHHRTPSSLQDLRPAIETLWLQKGRTIRQVVKILEEEHNLKTLERTLKRRLRQWGDRKRRPRNA